MCEMGDVMKILTEQEEKKLNRIELLTYYKNLIEYYKNMENTQKFTNLKKFLHPLLLNIMKTTLTQKLVLFNNKKINYEGPVIYAVNHTNSHDVPAISNVIKEHCYILAGTENLRLIERIMFHLNGVVFIDRKNSKMKNKSKDELIKILLDGNNLLIFPEGTWNISLNQIMLPLNWGIVEISKKSNAPVIPIVLEYFDDVYYANVGDAINFDIKETKEEGISRIRDSMATLRWEIWEKYKQTKRNAVSFKIFNQELEKAYSEYKKLDRGYEKTLILNFNDDAEQVFEHLKYLNYNKNNAFLLGKNKRMF